MDTTTILYLCIGAILFYFIFFGYKKESMTNVSEKDKIIVDALFNYITPETTFADYLNFLSSIKNTNLNIIDNDVFSTIKALKKKNLLKKEDIISEMNLKK
jgi:hypothetical protein